MRKNIVCGDNENGPYECVDEAGPGIGAGIISPADMPLMHKRLLKNLLYFDSFCREHKLRYCLSAGTCLGAVREGGFIPWDDDADVAMYRADYDRLFELWETHGDKEKFDLYRTTKRICAKVPIGLLRDRETTFIRNYEKQDDICHGVKIDIEPMDEIPNNAILRKIYRIIGRIYALFITQRIPNQTSRFIKIGSGILLGIFWAPQIRYFIWKTCGNMIKKYNGKGCNHIAINGVDMIMKRSDISNSITIDFEGHNLQIPQDYDSYLRSLYGNNYMIRPPAKERYPKSTYVFYDFNSSYEKYKGRYYCNK